MSLYSINDPKHWLDRAKEARALAEQMALKPADVPGRHRLESQPSSRTGENPPYGMIGGIEETSASFEARSAPRSYPTEPALRFRCRVASVRVATFGPSDGRFGSLRLDA